jgi:hypothetical protein
MIDRARRHRIVATLELDREAADLVLLAIRLRIAVIGDHAPEAPRYAALAADLNAQLRKVHRSEDGS